MPLQNASRALTVGLLTALSVAAVAGVGREARAATFDAASGTLKFDKAAAVTVSFDSLNGFGGLPVRALDVAHQDGRAQFSPSRDPLEAKAFLSPQEALEGAGGLRLFGNRGILLGDQASLAAFATGRVEITVFVRPDGAMPELRAVYERVPLDGTTLGYPLAQVLGIRTGRATSDGWVELSTGPIDGAIAGAPLRGIVLLAAVAGNDGSSFTADALEIHSVAGPLLSGGDCTLAHEADQCKKGAVCIEGHCTDGAAVYGALPPVDTRKDIVARTSAYLTRFQGDRHAVLAAALGFAKELPGIATSADTPAAFYRPLANSFANVRGAHTYAPAPLALSRLAVGAALPVRYTGTELGACFGIVEKDLLGGGRGYGVYATTSASPLLVGDVIEAVDGEAVDTWLARVIPEQSLLAADPDSDRAYASTYVSALVMRYGHDMSVKRCTAASVCTAVPVALDALRSGGTIEAIECTQRFKLAVDPKNSDPNAYEAAITETAADGVVSLHTNGEPLDNVDWLSAVTAAFDSGTTRLIIDKRRGDGGGGQALDTWAAYLRRGTSYGLFFVNRIDHAHIDGTPDFLDQVLGCSGLSTDTGSKCSLVSFSAPAPRGGTLPAKVAWLNVLDGSASDMAAYFAQGATGVRIFAPNRTLGLFGSLGIMGSFLPGWEGGSVQLNDTRTGATADERRSGTFRSGHGIDPDEILVQLQSDLLAGKDTMLERAHVWLGQ